MSLSDADLDRIERDAHEAHAPADFVPAQILALVAEVRRLRAVRGHVNAELRAVKGRQPLADEFPGATWALARVLGFFDDTAEPVDAEPAPLDTGRAVTSHRALLRRAIDGDQDAAAQFGFTPAPGESAEDFALRCWQVLDPFGPPPSEPLRYAAIIRNEERADG